jgi:DNA-directed RNA polymerase omega subunit
MSYIPLEKLIDKAGNNLFKLVIMASKRALELSEGMPRLVEASSDTTHTTVALKEIAEGKIRVKKE